MDDVILNKSSTIVRCLQRIGQEFGDGTDFRLNLTKQDSVLLNLQRACEAAIDMANHVIRLQQLGIPQSSRDSFALLARANCISSELAVQLQKMIGLRNIAVHDYQALNLDIVVHVVRHRLVDFELFIRQIGANDTPE